MVLMSLHLGNLSSCVHRDELERVFRRFGHCNVRVKDKFGFVVYDYPRDDEKALKTLRGKYICGEPIHLSWSNRQPRPLQKYARVVKSFEAVKRTHSANVDRGGGVEANLSENDRYEPDKADERKEQNILTHRDVSPSLRKPKQIAGMEQIEQITLNHSNDPKTLESRTSRRLGAGAWEAIEMAID
ncbi:hypothetical protein K7X08_007837 [Anisodus acutangulus]|uniref:RRM domain-containing protein n=1 Tax=Anisodus acutangulus TaxID=402998 RepID=A0A9Q1MTB2_9SOLA|nr:hypothetical protein K7X08_007837 [Anisodus acutangulus]